MLEPGDYFTRKPHPYQVEVRISGLYLPMVFTREVLLLMVGVLSGSYRV